MLKRVFVSVLSVLLLCLKMLMFVLFYINPRFRETFHLFTVLSIIVMHARYFKITDRFKFAAEKTGRAETTENRHQTMDCNCFAERNMFTGFALITYYY